MTLLAALTGRGVIAISGDDCVSFLNGLVSNEVARAVPGQAVWAAILTPQGRYAADFFIFADDERLLLDAPAEMIPALVAKLTRFKLRAAVQIRDASGDMAVYASWNGAPPETPITAPDPRLPEAGFRALSPTTLPINATFEDYAAHRLSLGLPDSAPDLEADKTLLLEAGFDELNGVDWKKGCYMGQELTARTKYRGLVKKRLLPVTTESTFPPPGTPILAEGVEVGTLRSSLGTMGLAMLRLDALAKPLLAGNALLTVQVPSWMQLPK